MRDEDEIIRSLPQRSLISNRLYTLPVNTIGVYTKKRLFRCFFLFFADILKATLAMKLRNVGYIEDLDHISNTDFQFLSSKYCRQVT